jgi:putative GTP pyrophosphokinase
MNVLQNPIGAHGTMAELTPAAITTWYRENVSTYEGLSEAVTATIKSLIKAKKIDHLGISARTKTLESMIEKMERKEYSDIDKMTDIAGVRVITYIESDISKVCELIKEAFQVHIDKSVDKSDELLSNQIGYRSVHFICELGDTRTALPELAAYRGMQFEVQIRTVLQHAWAEIEHDRSYKFASELPTPIRRRLNLLAGMLEIVDREFATLAHEVDEYGKKIEVISKSGKLLDVEITSVSIKEFLKTSSKIPILESSDIKSKLNFAIRELKNFGVITIADFNNLLSQQFLDALARNNVKNNRIGFIRDSMMYSDIDRYFEKARLGEWQIMDFQSKAFLVERYGIDKINSIFSSYDLLIEDLE